MCMFVFHCVCRLLYVSLCMYLFFHYMPVVHAIWLVYLVHVHMSLNVCVCVCVCV